MSEVFVVRNQLGHYWGKAKEWVDGTEPKAVMRAKHEDEAINTLFELSSKDFELRGDVLPVELNDKGEVVVEPSEHLLPKKADSEKEADGESAQSDLDTSCPDNGADNSGVNSVEHATSDAAAEAAPAPLES